MYIKRERVRKYSYDLTLDPTHASGGRKSTLIGFKWPRYKEVRQKRPQALRYDPAGSGRTSICVRRFGAPPSRRPVSVIRPDRRRVGPLRRPSMFRNTAGWHCPLPISARCVGQDLNLRTPTGQDPEPCAFDQAGPPTRDAAGAISWTRNNLVVHPGGA